MKYENIEIDLDDFRHLVKDIQSEVEFHTGKESHLIKQSHFWIIHESLLQIVKNSGLKITPNMNIHCDYEYPLFELNPFTDLNLITIDDVKNDTNQLTITLSDNWDS